MICFPNAKINIGLRVTEKRPDGYHNLETIFYPIHGFYDCLEFFEAKEFVLENIGIQIDAPVEKNLCFKAWKLFQEQYAISPIHVKLLKNIPFGGGLGGGSADATFLLSALNSYFSIGASEEDLENLALKIGSDCPFFVKNTPVFAEGRGEIFSKIDLSLKNYWIVLLKPNVAVGTAEAYRGVVPQKRNKKLVTEIPSDITSWKDTIDNDFEESVFKNHIEIAECKKKLYDLGAVYASMSGSGATVYGIFKNEIDVPKQLPLIWQGELK